MNKFGIGQAVSRFEDPRLVRGGGRYVDDMVLTRHGVRLRAALAPRPCAHPRDRCRRGEGRARRARGAHRRRLAKLRGWGDLPVPGGLKRRDGSPVTGRAIRRWCSGSRAHVGDYVAFVVAETYIRRSTPPN